MISRTSALVLFLLSCTVGFSQDLDSITANTKAARFGVFGNIDLPFSNGGFSGIPEVSSCCPEYTSTTGFGWLAGLAYIQPLSSELSLNLRMHYWTFNTPFTDTETLPIVDLTGGPSTATIEHSLEGMFQQISIEPLMSYRLVNYLNAVGGVTLGAAFASEFSQKETLIDPVDGTFVNKSRQRNVQQGAIPNSTVLSAGITLGLSYDLALSADRSLVLSPEVLFTYSIFNHTENMSWKTNHLRAGVGLSFVPPAVEDSLTDVELYEFARSVPPPTVVKPGVPFVSSVSHTGLNETGTETAASKIVIEEFLSTRVRPLLPYVFFTPGSSNLQKKYRRLSSAQVEQFSMSNFYNLDAIITYCHLLNIIGKRMIDEPEATITLTGCTDPSENDPTLAMSRARAVRDYLVQTWDIDERRITLASRGLPSKASRSSESDGVAENARVEITSSSQSVIAPVESTDTMKVCTPSAIRFVPSIDPRVQIGSYTLFIAHQGSLLKTFGGPDPLPRTIDWRLSESVPWIPKDATEITYLLAVRDTAGAVVPSPTISIPIEHISSSEKQEKGGQNIRVDRYSLILFGFDQDALTPEHMQTIEVIKKRLQPNSTVRVIGYTDRSGDAEYNQKLSERRARAVAKALGLAESVASGRGELLPLYDNSSPEGRFYSRTVEVLVETPQ